MKFRYFLILSTLVVAVFFGTATQSYSQNELVVEWDDGSGNIVQDALYNTVMGDTANDGSRLNLDRVYVLKAGGYYWNNAAISNNFPLRLVGEEPSETQQPAVVQMVLDINTSAAPGKMISCSDDLTLKNLYIIGQNELGDGGNYQPIEVNAIGKRFIIDNCVFERSDFSIVAWAGGRDNKIYITNSKFRNLIESSPSQQWTGRGVSVWTDADTVVVENCTFFNVNMCAIQIENGAANYVRFNHNTLVNVGRAFHSTTNVWWREAYFANLLLVNVFWHGEGASEYSPDFPDGVGRDPRAYTTGMFAVVSMPSRYGTNIGRRIGFANAAAYLDPYFSSRYADTVRVQPYINAVTDSFFTIFSPSSDPAGQMVIRDTAWLSAYPNFDVNPNTPAQLEAMYNHITASRGYQFYGTGVPAVPYYYALQIDGSDTLWAEPSWPLPENFHYTDNLTGSDGLPLGDLNWFPNEKATFEANKEQFIEQLQNIAGPQIVEDIVWSEEAEFGNTGGTADVIPFTGDAWYTVVGGSAINWTFDVTAGGAVDMVIKASLNNAVRNENDNVGFNFELNGSEIHDVLGWGEFVFWSGSSEDPNVQANKWYDIDDGEFHEVLYTQADIAEAGALQLQTGTNTVRIFNGWNNASFARIDFYEAGTQNLIASLIPADAVNEDATPGGEAVWVPRGFNSVNLGTGGTVDFNVDLEFAGQYKVRVFFQNADAVQTGNILLDGAEVSSFSFDSDPDSGGLDVISGLFDASAGTHTLRISGSGVKVDWAQLIRQYFTSVKELPELPDGFALSQNYPNPFNPKTNINFSIGKSSNVNMAIYNILGQKVITLIDKYMNAGTYSVDFDASHLASGVYFYRIEAGDFKLSKKMMLLK